MSRPLIPLLKAGSKNAPQNMATLEGPSSSDWERHRSTITKLYMDENKRLRQIIPIMTDLGHKATAAMYKKRLTKWNLTKNKKERDIRVLHKNPSECKALEKNTLLPPHHQDMSKKEVLQLFDSSRESRKLRDNVAFEDSTPILVSYRTSSPNQKSRIRYSPLPPPTLLAAEDLFASISVYLTVAFSPGMWSIDRNGHHVALDSAGTVVKDRCEDFWTYFTLAVTFFNNHSPVKFRRVLSKAFNLVKEILTIQHPRTLNTIFLVCSTLTQRGLSDVRSLLCRYISRMARMVVASNHPWGKICELIILLDTETYDEALLHSWKVAIDAYQKGLGVSDPFALEARCDFIWSIYGRDLPKEERLLREVLESVMHDPGVTNHLAKNLNAQGRYKEAEQLELDLLSRFGQMPVYTTELTGKAASLNVLAKSQYLLGNSVSAEKSLREAIAIMHSKFGPKNTWAVQYTVILEKYLRAWGRGDEADELKAEAEAKIGKDEIDEELEGVKLESPEHVTETTR